MKVKFFENFKHWRWAAGIGVMSAIGLALIPVWIEFQWYDDGKRFLGERAMKAEEIPAIIPARVETEELTVERILEWSRELLKSKTDDLPQNEITKIILGGDVMLGRAVNFNMHRKNNFGYPMEKIAERFKQADLALVNLEAPILTDCLLIGEGMKFCSNYQSLYTLFFAGIDAVQLANNHIWDYGDAGIEETQKWLEFQGIGYVGLGDPLVREVRGIKFGFLGYNQIFPIKEPVSTANERVLKQEIEELQLGVDVVIVGFHWGTEYQGQPSYVQRQ
jgi:poly-gamma-glutamate synthesis protein (capsule biosynthesis protein)